MDMSKDDFILFCIYLKAYIGLTKPTKIPPLLSIFDFDACYEGSTGGQIGVEFNQKSNGDVGFFPALLLADQ